MQKGLASLLILVWLLSACIPNSPVSTVDLNPRVIATPDTVLPIQTPTPDPSPYSLDYLANRSYGAGEFKVDYLWQHQDGFSRYSISYTSDNLNIAGFVNIPDGKGPFPVIIALHGFISSDKYQTLDYTTRYADSIARKGYIVIHPNLRNFPPSDTTPRVQDYNTGYVVDVLNLLALVRNMVGKEGIFKNADMNHLGIWGHSIGGGVALRVLSLVKDIKATVLYAAVSQRYANTPGIKIYDLASIQAALSLHHGTADKTIPVGWTQQLCAQLKAVGKNPECFYYEGAPHTFLSQGKDDALFIQRTIQFFDRYLK
jgi:dienelactone hydrolase